MCVATETAAGDGGGGDGVGPFDVARVRPLVAYAVRRKLHMFAAFPEYAEEDLIQEGILEAEKVHARYDPTKAQYTTWIQRVVGLRMIDLWRKRSRRAVHERAAAEAKPGYTVDDHAGRIDGPEELSLARWAAGVYGLARRQATRYLGRPEAATTAAVLALQRRLRLPAGEMALLLAERADLRRAMGLTAPPSEAELEEIRTRGLRVAFK